jgi:hypothetical protein
VLHWRSLLCAPAPAGLPHLMRAPHWRLTTSGRAALWQALRALSLPAGTPVLVPTYHCPTLVAPVVALGLEPRFYPIDDSGLPALALFDAVDTTGVQAIIVPHLFGRVQSLAAVRRWCDEREVALIEDCAHALMGQAGERPVGAWGDMATASLTKFIAVPEAGVLAAWRQALPAVPLRRAGLRQQLKAWVTVLERRPETDWTGRLVARWQRSRDRGRTSASTAPARPPVQPAMARDPVAEAVSACDMGRVDQRPTLAAAWLAHALPLGGPARRRRTHFTHFARLLQARRGAHALWPAPADDAAPYVFPLWVDDPDALYAHLRGQGLAVLRWDRVWPGTPQIAGDVGPAWSRHVLQLLCHQDLEDSDIARTTSVILQWLAEHNT